MAIPSLTRNLDDDFVNTWYEIRAEVIDNILSATVFWMALKNFGCLVTQPGGEYVTRTIGYGQKSTQRFSKGSTLTQTVVPLDTLAMWSWRYFLVDVNRTIIDDRKNSGKFKIKSYIARRIEAARDALVQDLETYVMQWGAYYDGDAQPNGIYDICPNATAESAVGAGSASDSAAVGTSNGGINRATNTWWRNWTAASGGAETPASFLMGPTNAPYSLNLVPDMDHYYNSISANQEPPNFILMNQLMYEAYLDEARDRLQIVRNSFTKKAVDLGFDAATFRGATITWTGKLASTTLHGFMLNMNHVEVPYHPDLWFDMLDWRKTSNQLESVNYIACMTPGLITDQPRRHGVFEYAS